MRCSRRICVLILAVLGVCPLLWSQPDPNLVVNGGFDEDLTGWSWDPRYIQAPGSEAWSPLDAQGSSQSGSLVLTVSEAGRARQLLQCVSITPGFIYEIGAEIYFPSENDVRGEALIAYVEYESSNCTGEFTGFGELKARFSDDVDVWQPISARPPVSPSAGSFQAILGAALRVEGQFAAHFDEVYVRLVPPDVTVPVLPETMIENPGEGLASTTVTFTNVGDLPASLTLEASAGFFSISSDRLDLPPRGSETVSIHSLGRQAGFYNGAIEVSGDGVPAGFAVPVRLASIDSSSRSSVTASETRVDFAAPAETRMVEGQFSLDNPATESIEVAFDSDVPWILPPEELITIGPGESQTVPFTIDRSKRFDEDDLAGSVTGSISARFFGNQAGKLFPSDSHDQTNSEAVSVTDSIAQPIGVGQIPPLAGSVAMFLPGVGHVRGSVGTFVSDVSMAASKLVGLTPDVELFYSTMGSSPQAVALKISNRMRPNQYLNYADIVRSYFGREGETGSLQIRLALPSQLTVNASVFNKSNPSGTYGTSIPVLRSDRATASGRALYLTGLRGSSDQAHTNLILQETAGGTATVDIDFLRPDGTVVSQLSATVPPFRAVRLNDSVPPEAVSAILTNRVGSNGRFQAFATPVDKAREADGTRKGGDTWVSADWPTIYDYSRHAPLIMPVAGVARGAGNTLFRTDLALMNVGNTEATGELVFRAPDFPAITRTLTLQPRQTATYSNLLGTLFDIENAPVGYLTFQTLKGQFTVTGRVFATVGDQVATFGTAVPTLAASSGLRKDDRTRITGFHDSSLESILSKRPGTFRTNLGMVETTGKSARIRVTLHNFLPKGTTSLSSATAWREFDLPPNGFLLLPRISHQLLGPRRDLIAGDLNNLFADFEVVQGEGRIIPFVSSVDNGTADQILLVP